MTIIEVGSYGRGLEAEFLAERMEAAATAAKEDGHPVVLVEPGKRRRVGGLVTITAPVVPILVHGAVERMRSRGRRVVIIDGGRLNAEDRVHTSVASLTTFSESGPEIIVWDPRGGSHVDVESERQSDARQMVAAIVRANPQAIHVVYVSAQGKGRAAARASSLANYLEESVLAHGIGD